tara:strand:+ start:645 stop:761 length:117 start_codon:yes stop_codon:yes gene_type:complete
MQKRKFGNTNIHLFSLGFGATPIGDLLKKLIDERCLTL